MTDEMPPIPSFLLRGHDDCIIPVDAFNNKAQKHEKEIEQEISQPRLTAVYKDKVAMDIVSTVKDGNDTFGKIRKALPQYGDRELKAGIRHAKKWMPMLERRGTNKNPQMHRYQIRLTQDGRRYSVVKY